MRRPLSPVVLFLLLWTAGTAKSGAIQPKAGLAVWDTGQPAAPVLATKNRNGSLEGKNDWTAIQLWVKRPLHSREMPF